MSIPTTEKLAAALEEAGAPKAMVEAALAGRYDDFESESESPIRDLVRDLYEAARALPEAPARVPLLGLAQRVKKGDFDATREESEEWAAKNLEKF